MKSPALRSLARWPVSPLIVFAAAWLLALTEWIQRVEWRTLDWRTELRVPHQPTPDPRITIVLYEDTTEMEFMPWPPDRAVHADMIKFLTLAQPAVITWDVIMDATREGDGDAEMGRAAAIANRAGVKVITAAVTSPDPVEAEAVATSGPTQPLTDVTGDVGGLLGDAHALLPFPPLREASLYGFADTPAGRDGVRREIPLVVRVGAAVYPSLALQTLMAYFDVAPEKVRVRLGDGIYLPGTPRGDVRLPVDRGGRFLLNYRYDQDEQGADFASMNYFGALLALQETFVDKTGTPDLPALKGGIVFIGQTVTGKADAGPTPRGPLSPLVLVHANLVHNVITGDYARRAPPWIVWGGAVLLGYAGVITGRRWPLWALGVFTMLPVALYVAAAVVAWIRWSLWLPLTAPVAGFLVLQFWVVGRRVRQEQLAREQVKQMFGNYLSPELLKKMMKNGLNVAAVSSERRPVTILFSDLRDFTALTERLKDDALILQLNEYLAAMVECIHREGGTLHKFIGDAVMAVWGDLASEGPAADAQRAARAALAMQATLEQLNAKWRAAEMPELRMGIGLNHGTVLIGNIGSPRRMEFTAIGDAVNLASRLESLNKELKTSTLVGETLHDFLNDAFRLRPCGSVKVKGKAQPVQVFELLGVN